ncbi:MAG: hypothetical protein IJ253_08925 [Bacteroidaceae bacterium]|nr:hypothetical protein [Bacteroidaceae bacterium]
MGSRLSKYGNRYGTYVTLLAIPAMCFALLRLEGDVLFRAQELSLFLFSRHFYERLCIYPGGTLSWLACLATTCFHSKAETFIMLCLAWGSCSAMAIRLFRLRGWWSMLALLLPLALLACMVQTGYWLYYQKLPGHMMVPTLGMTFAIIAACTHSRLRKHHPLLGLAWMIACASVGYPLLGAWSFAATALMMWPDGMPRRGEWRWPLISAGLGVVLILLVPQVAYQHLYTQVARAQLYRAAMPTFGIDNDDFAQYRLPYLALALSLLPAMLCRMKPETWLSRTWQRATIVLALTGAALWGVRHVWYTDTNFHREIRQSLAIEKLDWEGVLRIARETSDTAPTRIMVLNRTLALFRLGRAGDEIFHYLEGDTPPRAPWLVHISQVNGKSLYYHYGLENFCYRWCMEQGIETGWNVDELRLMVKASLINGDYGVARKYLGLLSQTRHHREWAIRYTRFLHHPELVAQDEEMGPILHLMDRRDRLDTDHMQVEIYLLDYFALNGGNKDPLRQELNLLCAMLTRDIPSFWARFFEYVPSHAQDGIPRHFQEAAFLYGQLEQTVDTSHMPFDPEVRQTYEEFMRFNEQCGTMTLEQKKVAFRPRFGHTFFYYYFLVRGLKTA